MKNSDIRKDIRRVLLEAASHFLSEEKIIDIREFGSGNIHDTFLIAADSISGKHFVLQRVNTRVFKRPELVMQNMRIATEHMKKRLSAMPSLPGRSWKTIDLIGSKDGHDYWQDKDGSLWRCLTYIEGAQSYKTIRGLDHSREVGYSLGFFHLLLGDLSSDNLAETIEGFHITPLYINHYDDVLAGFRGAFSAEMDYCRGTIRKGILRAGLLEDAKNRGELIARPIHGDPKVDNILIDIKTGKSVSIIDLDTIMPGLIHYDIADCLRSACNTLGENAANPDAVSFDVEIFRSLMHGYTDAAGDSFTSRDLNYLYDAIHLIPFELGLRFFTDYLEGNIYFKVSNPEHNLARAVVQFKLAESIESQEEVLRKIIGELG